MTDGTETLPSREMGAPVKSFSARMVQNGVPEAQRPEASTVEEPLTIGTAEGNSLVLTDPTTSRYHVELQRDGDRICVIDLGSTNGTQIGPTTLRGSQAWVEPGTRVRLGNTEIELLEGEVQTRAEPGPKVLQGLIAHSSAMRRVSALVTRLAESEVSIIIDGESGAGKEVVARAIHAYSERAAGPFLTLDCAAIANNLFSSQLFGHERGAFTGATTRYRGAFEQAHGGTLFLDEIGELAPALQVKLLGVLERRKLTRVGGEQPIDVDVRVLAATHRDLRAEVNNNRFRPDLYYRLAVARITVPPLRERPADVVALTEHFLAEEGHEGTAEELFGAETLEEMKFYPWPGNVRELRNVVVRAMAMGNAPELTNPSEKPTIPAAILEKTYGKARDAVVHEFERRYLGRLMERSNGKVRAAARIAEMNRSYLTELLRRHGIK